MATQGDSSFGEALRAAIDAAGYTQAKLAHELGIDAGQISRWVNNRVAPHRSMVEKIGATLGSDLTRAFATAIVEHELYVSAPITGLDLKYISSHNDIVGKVVDATRRHVPTAYWPGESVRDIGDLRAPDIATEHNMKVLEHCSALLYVQFNEVVRPSSALIELGCALGRRLKTTIMIQKGLTQPFMLQNFGNVAPRVSFLPKARIYEVTSVEHACDLITKNGRELLGLETRIEGAERRAT